MSLDKEVERVGEIMDRLIPMIERYVRNLAAREGNTIGVSVASNVGTTLIAYALTIVKRHGGDSDEMWRLLRMEIIEKATTLQIQAEQSHTLQ
jgi:hypothetical protein